MAEKIKCKYCDKEYAKNVIKRHEQSCSENPKNTTKIDDKKSEVKKEGNTVSEEKLTTAQKIASEAKKNSKGRVRIPKDTEIIIMKNVLGGWTYENKSNRKLFRIANGATTTIMTMAELMEMHSRYPKMLNTFMVVPVDTFDDEYTVEDVIQNLGIERAYKEAVNPLEIEEAILDMPYDKFADITDKLSKGMKARIIEKSIELFRNGEFNDPTKKSFIIKLADNNDMIFEKTE